MRHHDDLYWVSFRWPSPFFAQQSFGKYYAAMYRNI
jgi:hypothetical protein